MPVVTAKKSLILCLRDCASYPSQGLCALSVALTVGFFQCLLPEASSFGNFCLRKGCGAEFWHVKPPYEYKEALVLLCQLFSSFSSVSAPMLCYRLFWGVSEITLSYVANLIQWYTNAWHVYIQGEMVLTSQEFPVYWGGQEHCSTVFPGPPVPSGLISSRPTSPRLSRWVWVKYRAWILSPTKSARTIISSSLETGLLLIAWRQFPCRSQFCTSDLTWWACSGSGGSTVKAAVLKCFLHL